MLTNQVINALTYPLKGWVNVGVVDTVSQFIIKYHHWDTYTPKDQTDWANNLPILRYTDVMMMNAEALNELDMWLMVRLLVF